MNTAGMKRIGKGAFSTVYRQTKKKVLIKSTDNVKECLSMGWMPDHAMFPTTERVGVSDCGEYQFYEQKYYPKVSSLKNNLSSFEWEFYKALRELFICKDFSPNPHTLHQEWHDAFDTLPGKFWRKRELLKEALDGLANYGSDICFEISPRNVAASGGKLVLLDCFFFKSQLKF